MSAPGTPTLQQQPVAVVSIATPQSMARATVVVAATAAPAAPVPAARAMSLGAAEAFALLRTACETGNESLAQNVLQRCGCGEGTVPRGVAELLRMRSADTASTALQLACRCDQVPAARVPLAKLLLAAGAPIAEADRNRDTPLHHAARRGDAALVAVLLAAGAGGRAQLLAQNDFGDTALHCSCRLGQAAVTAALVQADAGRLRREEQQEARAGKPTRRLDDLQNCMGVRASELG